MIRFLTFVFLVSALVSSALASTPPSFAFHWANNIPVGTTPFSAAVADLNGDGFQDIVTY
jgi:VCBS repeat protein